MNKDQELCITIIKLVRNLSYIDDYILRVLSVILPGWAKEDLPGVPWYNKTDKKLSLSYLAVSTYQDGLVTHYCIDADIGYSVWRQIPNKSESANYPKRLSNTQELLDWCYEIKKFPDLTKVQFEY